VINHIDVSVVLRRSVCDLYSNLVTRPTGAAVRTEIENLLAECVDPSLTVIDFSHVNLLDYSCADEVVAKLLLRFASGTEPEAYFLVRGVREWHFDPLESVLERHGLALVVEYEDGSAHLMGTVGEPERYAWQTLHRLRRAQAADLAIALGADAATATMLLEALHARRLVMRLDDEYLPLGEPA
jgi:hypothetical protein